MKAGWGWIRRMRSCLGCILSEHVGIWGKCSGGIEVLGCCVGSLLCTSVIADSAWSHKPL